MTQPDEHTTPSSPLQEFFREISILEHLTRNRMEQVLPDGMKAPHFAVLSHLITTQSKETPAELASNFQVTRPTMTNTLQRLDAKKYINIAPDPKDGRGKLVWITSEGEQAFFKAIGCLGPRFDDLSAHLGEEIFREVLPALKTIRRFMDNHR